MTRSDGGEMASMLPAQMTKLESNNSYTVEGRTATSAILHLRPSTGVAAVSTAPTEGTRILFRGMSWQRSKDVSWTLDEKIQLSQDLKRLPENMLENMVHIVLSREPSELKDVSGCIKFNLVQ